MGEWKQTLCWCCAKAVNGGCSWSNKFEPVDGWRAEPSTVRSNITGTPRVATWLVIECPEFVEG